MTTAPSRHTPCCLPSCNRTRSRAHLGRRRAGNCIAAPPGKDRRAFGGSGRYLTQFAWTPIVRHRMVPGTAPVDDPAWPDIEQVRGSWIHRLRCAGRRPTHPGCSHSLIAVDRPRSPRFHGGVPPFPHQVSTVVFHLRVTTAPGPAGSVSHKLSAQTGRRRMERRDDERHPGAPGLTVPAREMSAQREDGSDGSPSSGAQALGQDLISASSSEVRIHRRSMQWSAGRRRKAVGPPMADAAPGPPWLRQATSLPEGHR